MLLGWMRVLGNSYGDFSPTRNINYFAKSLGHGLIYVLLALNSAFRRKFDIGNRSIYT